jgi:hypothetical protein
MNICIYHVYVPSVVPCVDGWIGVDTNMGHTKNIYGTYKCTVDSAAYASMGGLATAAVSMRVIVLSKCISCVETYMGHIEDMQAIYQGYMRVDAFSNCNSCVNTYAARVVSLGLV